MSDIVSQEIIEVRKQIFELLQNNHLDRLKQLNFITDKREKKDYIQFILLVMYSELEYFQGKRKNYQQFLPTRDMGKKNLKNMIESLNFVSKNIDKCLIAIYQHTPMEEIEPFLDEQNNDPIDIVKSQISTYQKNTIQLLDKLEKFDINNLGNIVEKTEEFLIFHTREIHKPTVIRNSILRYICLITQICFGHKNKYSLFCKLLDTLYTNNKNPVIPADVKYIVKHIDIENREALKGSFSGKIHLIYMMKKHNLLDGYLYRSKFTEDEFPLYEKFLDNVFFEKYLIFKDNLRFL